MTGWTELSDSDLVDRLVQYCGGDRCEVEDAMTELVSQRHSPEMAAVIDSIVGDPAEAAS